MTIQQLQDFINTKPDIRQLINVIADYMQNNPGGGGSFPAQLTADTTIDLNGKKLFFLGGNTSIEIDPILFEINIGSGDGTAEGYLYTVSDLAGNKVLSRIVSRNATNEVKIEVNAQTNSITHTAATHKFTGAIETDGLPGLSQDIIIPSSGTATFTNGLLTAFTPE